MDYVTALMFLCPIMFLASFVDAVSGGGGLISLPAYLFTGMTVHNAYACNKVCYNISTAIAALRYYRNGLVDRKVSAVIGGITFLCSLAASRIVLWLPDRPLQFLVLCSMPFVAVLIMSSRKYPEENRSGELEPKTRLFFWIMTGLVMGSYDGILGPGSGTLAIILFTKWLKYDLKTASGNAKMVVFSSSLAGSISYILAGKVLWSYALPVLFCGILGGYVGAGMAIKKGARFIRPMMLVIAAVLIIKLFAELLGVL